MAIKIIEFRWFTIPVDSDKLFLARQASYLGLWVRNDLSWDYHILELCRKMYYHFHMFRRLRKNLPSALVLKIYTAYVQSKIDYGLFIWGCTTEVNLNRVQRIQSLLTRIICNNFDYIHSRGIDLVRSLKLQTIRERRDRFLCVLMVMIQGALRIWIYIYHGATRRFIKDVFLYKGSSLWNKLRPWVKESTSLNDFKHDFKLLNGWIHLEFIVLFICTPIL